MTDPVIETELRVEDLAAPERQEAVRGAVLALDPAARLVFEPEHGLVRIASRAQSLEIADALAQAGLGPTAMTG